VLLCIPAVHVRHLLHGSVNIPYQYCGPGCFAATRHSLDRTWALDSGDPPSIHALPRSATGKLQEPIFDCQLNPFRSKDLTSPNLQNETMNLFNSYSSLIKSSGAGDKVCALLDLMPPPPGTGSAQVLSHMQGHGASNSDHEQCTIFLRDVHFRYPSRPEHRVLNGLSLKIPVGKTVALVGPSGKFYVLDVLSDEVSNSSCCNRVRQVNYFSITSTIL
jgi:hypothetical protein